MLRMNVWDWRVCLRRRENLAVVRGLALERRRKWGRMILVVGVKRL